MCLDRKPTRDQIIRDFKKKIEVEKGSYVGYKIFQKHNKKLHAAIFDLRRPYELNTWIIDDNKATVNYIKTEGRYRCGFHVYINKEEAERVFEHYKRFHYKHKPVYSLRKIFFNKIIAYGYENIVHFVSVDKLPDVRTIITREMFIPKMR